MTRDEHLLSCLAEECAEVAQRVSKALRFGLEEVQPGQPFTNAERIVYELIDLKAVVGMLEDPKLLAPLGDDSSLVADKVRKVNSFMQYAKAMGALQGEAP